MFFSLITDKQSFKSFKIAKISIVHLYHISLQWCKSCFNKAEKRGKKERAVH